MAEIAPVRGRATWIAPAGQVAMLLLAVQAVWRGAYLLRGYYVQDDFRMLELGGSSPLSWGYLFQEYSGHLWPGDFLVAWLTARGDPMSWTTTALSLLAIQLGAGALMWSVLGRLMGDTLWRLPVLAVFLFSPLTLWSIQWWAQAIGYLPVTFFLLAATWALLRLVQDGWGPGAPLAVTCFALALCFQERALLGPVLLGGVAVVLAQGPPLARLRTVVVTRWRLWLALVVVAVGYLLLHARIAPVESGDVGAGTPVGSLTWDFVGRTLLPGLAGGPWGGDVLGGLLVPATAAVVAGGVVGTVVVAVTLRRGGSSARWGWLMLAIYVLGDIALLFGGRTRSELSLGLLPRYVADVVPVATIALAAALRERGSWVPARWRDRAWARPTGRRTAALVALVTAGYVASAGVSTTHMAPAQLNEEAREYVHNLRADLRSSPEVVLYDGVVPDDVMIAWFGDERRVSTVLANAPENPVFDLPSRVMRMPDDDGRLRPLRLVFETPMEPAAAGDPCGYPVTASGTSVPLTEATEVDRWVLRLEYFTGVSTQLSVTTAGVTQVVALPRGAARVDLVVSGTLDHVDLAIDDTPGTLCVTGLSVGFPQPDTGT